MTLPSPAPGCATLDLFVERTSGGVLVAGEGAVAGEMAGVATAEAGTGAGTGAAVVSAFVAGLATGGAAGTDGAVWPSLRVSTICISTPSEGRYDASSKNGERFAPG